VTQPYADRAVPSSDHDIASTNQDKIIGLRANAFAAVVMLLIELGLGVGVNLYSNLPASDHGKGLLTAFGAAVTGGPVALTLHALLGTLLLITGIAAVVRATLARRTLLICIAILAFVAILVAWVTGTEFVGDMSNGKSLVMAVATALAILCYATLLFIAPTPRSSSRR
jgi:hypothetical protein